MVAAKRCLSAGRLASLRTQQQIALLVLLDVGTLVVGAQHREAFVAPVQDSFKLAVIAAVDAAPEDLPGLG